MIKASGDASCRKRRLLNSAAFSFYVLHDLSRLDLKPQAAGIGVVVSGHSHIPKQEMRDGVLYFNPGSAGPRRFKLPVTVGRLIVDANRVEAKIIPLDSPKSNQVNRIT